MSKRFKNDPTLVSAYPDPKPSVSSSLSTDWVSCHQAHSSTDSPYTDPQAAVLNDAACIANSSTDIPFFSYYDHYYTERQGIHQEQYLHPFQQSQQQTAIHPLSGIDHIASSSNCTTRALDDSDTVMTSSSLLEGWKMRKRKQSIFEVETNIHTLSELYISLIKLREQLPRDTTTEAEEAETSLPKSNTATITTRRSSSIATDSLSVRTNSLCLSSGSGGSSVTTPMNINTSSISSSDSYVRLLSTYPSFIFDLLVQVYLDCLCFKRVSAQRLLEQHRKGELDPAYVCAIYAYAGLHVLLCHYDRYGVYSFMNVLVHDAYQVAHECVEFDAINDTTTVETLVIMHQYLTMTQQSPATTGEKTACEATARHLLGLAKQQMDLILPSLSHTKTAVEPSTMNAVKKTRLEQEHEQNVHRLLLWMAEIDWSFTVFSNSKTTAADSCTFIAPFVSSQQVKASLDKVKVTAACLSGTDDDDVREKEAERLYIKAMKFRLKGLQILLSLHTSNRESENTRDNSQKSTKVLCQHLNRWRSKYLTSFLYKRHQSNSAGDIDNLQREQEQGYTLEDKLALRLHALYFAGMLELHQQSMLEGFESDREIWQSKSKWSDYFIAAVVDSDTVGVEQKAPLIKQHNKVEKGLYRSMNAAYGFIQVIQLLLEENDPCLLPQVIDTLSAACTVLYFGKKIAVCSPEMVQKSERALTFVMNAFLTSTTAYESMVECPRIHRFVKKWSPLILGGKQSDC